METTIAVVSAKSLSKCFSAGLTTEVIVEKCVCVISLEENRKNSNIRLI